MNTEQKEVSTAASVLFWALAGSFVMLYLFGWLATIIVITVLGALFVVVAVVSVALSLHSERADRETEREAEQARHERAAAAQRGRALPETLADPGAAVETCSEPLAPVVALPPVTPAAVQAIIDALGADDYAATADVLAALDRPNTPWEARRLAAELKPHGVAPCQITGRPRGYVLSDVEQWLCVDRPARLRLVR